MAESTTPDFSGSPRKRFEAVVLDGLAADPIVPIKFDEPSVLYLQAATTDGTSTISFTPWEGAAVVGVPIFSQGKFDLSLIKSIEGVEGVEDMWRAF